MDPKLSNWLASLAPAAATDESEGSDMVAEAAASHGDAGDGQESADDATATVTASSMDGNSDGDSDDEDDQTAVGLLAAALPRMVFPPALDTAARVDTSTVTLHVRGDAGVVFNPVLRDGRALEVVLEVFDAAAGRVWARGRATDAAGGDLLFVVDVSAPVGPDVAQAPPSGDWLLFKAADELASDGATPGGTGRLSGPGPAVYGLLFESPIDAMSTSTVLAELRAKLEADAFMRRPPNDPELVVAEGADGGGDVRAASLDRLLDRLTFPPPTSHFSDFTKQFLLTYRSFTTPVALLAELYARFFAPLPAVLAGTAKADQWVANVQGMVRARIVKVLHTWISQGVRDFLDDPVLEDMLAFVLVAVEEAGFETQISDIRALYDESVAHETLNTHLLDIVRLLETNVKQREAKWRMKAVGLCFQGQDAVDYLFHAGVCSSRENAVAVSAQILAAGYITHVSGDAAIPFDDNFQLFRFNLEVVESAVRGMGSGTGNRPPPELPRNLADFEVDDLPIVEFARQETLLEYALYSKVQPKELLGLAWSKSGKEERSPNVLGLIRRFNALSLWVVTEITRRFVVKDRAKAIKYFVALAATFRDIGNLNALQAIISGFSNNSVKRLKFTWAKLDKKSAETLEELRELLSFKGSFFNLRAYLQRVVPPCIPFIGMYLTDLTFIHEGNPSMVDGLINFEKHSKVASIIQSLLTYQAIPFAYETVPQIKLWLSSLDGADDDTTYDWSLEIESREAHSAGSHSKDQTSRFKALGRRPRVYANTADSLARASKSVSAVHQATRLRSSSSLTLDDEADLARFRSSLRTSQDDLNLSSSSLTFGRSPDARASSAGPSAHPPLASSPPPASPTTPTARSRRTRMPSALLSPDGSASSPLTAKRASSPSLERLTGRSRSDSIGVRLTDPGTGASPPRSGSSPLRYGSLPATTPPASSPAPPPAVAPAATAPAPASDALTVTNLIEAALDRDGKPGPAVHKVKAVLDAGVDIDDVNERGNTALHYATIDSRVDVAKYLISRGASVDIPNLQGITPLHIATLRANIPLVKLLIMAGADPDVRNNQGKSANDMTDNADIRALLAL